MGSRIIDQTVRNITDEKLRPSQGVNKEFDLSQVKGNVVITKKVTIPASQTIVVKGLTKVTGHHKHVHVMVEPSPKCQNIFLLGNTTEIKPGASWVDVVNQNLSGMPH